MFLQSVVSFDQSKETGARYKALDSEEKARWQAKADKAKEVYNQQMEEYEKTKKPKESPAPKSKKKKQAEPEPSSGDSSSEDDDLSVDSDSS